MSKAANSLTVSDAESVTSEPLPDSSTVALTQGEVAGEPGVGPGADLAGHGLLSRPTPPQGRRSLFRR